MEQIECSETSAYKIQTPGNHPEENIHHVFSKQKTQFSRVWTVIDLISLLLTTRLLTFVKKTT
jgi:hypothetical protein